MARRGNRPATVKDLVHTRQILTNALAKKTDVLQEHMEIKKVRYNDDESTMSNNKSKKSKLILSLSLSLYIVRYQKNLVYFPKQA